MSSIRPATVRDLPGAYRVCVQTGDAGRDASGLYRNHDLLGHVFVGPYIVGQPDLAVVVADGEGIGGYLLAADDTRRFEAWCEEHWWPALRTEYPPTDGESPDAELVRLFHAPPRSPQSIVEDYPSHLHIDLLPRMRGKGLGRTLIEQQLTTLRARGSRGIHLDVASDNENARAFYGHLGFREVERADSSVLMGLRLV